MAKKTATPKNGKETTPAKPAAKPAAKRAAKAAPKPAAKPASKGAIKGTLKPQAARTAKGAAPVKRPAAKQQPVPSADEIALRAYFLAEKRQQLGLPGDAHSDWLEAERQLLGERQTAPATR